MEILSLATDKARNALYDYHDYADNNVDSPILSPESLEYHDEEL